MKLTKGFLTALLVFSLLLFASIVSAANPEYSNTNYNTDTAPTLDGKYTTATEWDGGGIPPKLPSGLFWKEMWTYPGDILQHFIIEVLYDSTNDAGDYIQICYDCNADGGTAPQSDDVKIEYVGHSLSGLSLYVGNGTGWTKFTNYTYGTDIKIAESQASSPQNSNPHWIIEITINKSNPRFDISGSGYQPGLRIAAYDASNASSGVTEWPSDSGDSPAKWGVEVGTMNTIPEPLTVAAFVLLTTVAVAVGSRFLRISSKPRSSTSKINLQI
ncbi:MAG: hypothetical protein QXJ76_08320 [Candidatus Bathyarchaeia archaeon]